jgi:hypothetical protein
MDEVWQRVFRERMRDFKLRSGGAAAGVPVSIKVRVVSGCFHREHSPQAYQIIDHRLEPLIRHPLDFSLEEHESGPEILVYIAVATAGITLAKSVIDLITAIINARADGVKKGDRPSDPLELIVRRIDKGDQFREEIVFRASSTERPARSAVERQLKRSLRHLIEPKSKSPPRKATKKKRSPSGRK